MKQRTKPQRDLLKVIEDLCGEYGRSPTQTEIGERLDIAQSSVNKAIQSAVRRGDLTHQPFTPYSVKVVSKEV